jgi:hypothetical protein
MYIANCHLPIMVYMLVVGDVEKWPMCGWWWRGRGNWLLSLALEEFTGEIELRCEFPSARYDGKFRRQAACTTKEDPERRLERKSHVEPTVVARRFRYINEHTSFF